MLTVRNLQTGYGKKQVLFDVSLEVQEGEIVALIGPNGAGKSTVMRAVCGLIPAWRGEIWFDGTVTNGSTPARNVRRGMTFAPQGNRVFHELTIMENLEVGGFQIPRKDLNHRIGEVLEFFPALKSRQRQEAGSLSGGEQQMLALARALIPRPKLLMLDEPSLGLSPNLVNSVFEQVGQINRETGTAGLIVEQKARKALAISCRAYGLRLGRIHAEGSPEQFLSGDVLKQMFLG